MSAVRKLMDEVAQLGGRLSLNGDKVRVAAPAPLPDDLLAKLRELKPEIAKELAPPVPTYDPARLQREADRRNSAAVRDRVTDRWCACGRMATLAYPNSAGRNVWHCLECLDAYGRAQ